MILSDTVGFIPDLPTQLVAAFRATLEEVLAADLILHVRAISHADREEQGQDVTRILADLGVDDDVPMIEVWNKTERLPEAEQSAMTSVAARRQGVQPTSTLTGDGVDLLLGAVEVALDEKRNRKQLVLPFSAGKRRAWLYNEGVVEEEAQGEDGIRVTVNWTRRQARTFQDL